MDKTYVEALEQESRAFFFLCGDEDKTYILSRRKKRSVEDNVRLMCVMLFFGFRKVFLRFSAMIEPVLEETLQRYAAVRNDYRCIRGWLEQFAERVPDGKARRLAREFVEEKFRNAAEDAFDFNNVLSEP